MSCTSTSGTRAGAYRAAGSTAEAASAALASRTRARPPRESRRRKSERASRHGAPDARVDGHAAVAGCGPRRARRRPGRGRRASPRRRRSSSRPTRSRRRAGSGPARSLPEVAAAVALETAWLEEAGDAERAERSPRRRPGRARAGASRAGPPAGEPSVTIPDTRSGRRDASTFAKPAAAALADDRGAPALLADELLEALLEPVHGRSGAVDVRQHARARRGGGPCGAASWPSARASRHRPGSPARGARAGRAPSSTPSPAQDRVAEQGCGLQPEPRLAPEGAERVGNRLRAGRLPGILRRTRPLISTITRTLSAGG